MFNALSDFLIYCRVERRLADLTCKAYERDVRACLGFMRSQGIVPIWSLHHDSSLTRWPDPVHGSRSHPGAQINRTEPTGSGQRGYGIAPRALEL
jgi:hypothetical protein